MTMDTLRRELRTLRADLAAARSTGVLRRWGATSSEELKYDPHAVHQPAGTGVGGRGVGGQFAPKGGGAAGALRAAAAQAGRAALADPHALAAAGPGAAALAAGGVAVSRQAGLYAHYMDGQAITPILGLPGGKLETGPPPLQAGASGGDQVRSAVGRL